MNRRSLPGRSPAGGGARPPRSPYHPFRIKAVESHDRPLIPTLPMIMPAWPWPQALVAAALLVAAACLWLG